MKVGGAGQKGIPTPDPARALAALESALEDLNEAMAAVEALIRRFAESLPAGGNWEIVLFESGMIIAANPSTDTATTYKADRIDFRTFHRSASDDRPVHFEITSLGEMRPIS
jgi:hypothetical protein